MVDEMHIAMAPILLGTGESLFANLDLPSLGYICTEHVPTEQATHLVIKNMDRDATPAIAHKYRHG